MIWTLLFQANAANIRELKAAMKATKPEGTANITAALFTGFEILRRVSNKLTVIESQSNTILKQNIKAQSFNTFLIDFKKKSSFKRFPNN